MAKFMAISKEELEKLPTEVVVLVKEHLKCFDQITITYENGKYDYGNCIKAHYAPDHKFIGTVYVEDIYSGEERNNNFKEAFGYARWPQFK